MTQQDSVEIVVTVLVICIINYLIFMKSETCPTNQQMFIAFTINVIALITVSYRMTHSSDAVEGYMTNKKSITTHDNEALQYIGVILNKENINTNTFTAHTSINILDGKGGSWTLSPNTAGSLTFTNSRGKVPVTISSNGSVATAGNITSTSGNINTVNGNIIAQSLDKNKASESHGRLVGNSIQSFDHTYLGKWAMFTEPGAGNAPGKHFWTMHPENDALCVRSEPASTNMNPHYPRVALQPVSVSTIVH